MATEERISVSRTVGAAGLGLAWLLLFFGPPGWVLLVIIASLRSRGETLTIRVPCSAAARERSAGLHGRGPATSSP